MMFSLAPHSRLARRFVGKVALLLASFAANVALAAPLSPAELRVNDTVDPVGTEAAPYFGWLVRDSAPHAIQTRYQIRIATTPSVLRAGHADIWDSGEVTSRRQNHLAYAGPALAADTRYYWQVRTWDAARVAGDFSPIATFTVGLLANPDWSGAAWVRRDTADVDDYTYYRKQSALPAKPVVRATAYVTGVHKYALYVNGALIGKGPAYQYPQYQYYNAWDITPAVSVGGPVVFGVFNHWFGGGQGRPTSERGILFKAVVHYADGTTVVIGSDGSWKQTKALAWDISHPVHRRESEGVGYVERIDARRWVADWARPHFDDAAWAPVTVIGSQPTAPWTGVLTPDLSRIEENEIGPVAISDQGGGRTLVDFGKVYAGVPRIVFSGGVAGAAVQLHGGYALKANGTIDPAQNQGANLDYTAVLDGREFVFEPVETEGFRYLVIEGAPMPITAQNCRFITRHTQMQPALSSFTSSNETLNAVWGLMKHTLTVSAHEQFWDTPSREKGSFLGDSIWQSIAAMPVMGERVLTRRAMTEFLQSMEQYWNAPADRGRMNAVYPNGDGARDIPDNTQTYLVWVWEYYLQTGDRDFLLHHYDSLRAIADNVERARVRETGLVTRLPGGDGQYLHGIIDWPPSMRFGYDVTTTARTVVNALAWADFDVIARIAAELGKTDDRDLYRARADALQHVINAQLLPPTGGYSDGLKEDGTASAHRSQHASSLPLALGLVPRAQQPVVVAHVNQLGMSVGMETVWWLIRALGTADQGESLFKLLTDESAPGWARCLKRGATTTWESWFADEERNNSMSHGWGAIGLRAYTDYILGVQALSPQCETVRIKPLDFGAKLARAAGHVATDRGPIAVEWTRTATQFNLKVTLPPNVTATVYVPAGADSDLTVKIDGIETTGTRDGRYLAFPGIGAGAHTFERSLRATLRSAGLH